MTPELESFQAKIFERGQELYRDLPWRHGRDPYAIWVSEAMLQQTQVSRVDGRWQHWLERFPTPDALAASSSADVLDEWQGLGYNRRALSLWKAAGIISKQYAGQVPPDEAALKALPGIGPATAAGIRAFAFDMSGVYLETNVRTVFLHELFPEAHDVPDTTLTPFLREMCPEEPVMFAGVAQACTPRSWYYALLDYGAYLKKILPNPSRRSRTHTRQSRFDGSHRQKRAAVVRMLLSARSSAAGGISVDDVMTRLTAQEVDAGREPVQMSYVESLLSELSSEGFCHESNGLWHA